MATATIQNPPRCVRSVGPVASLSERKRPIQFWRGLVILYFLIAGIAWVTWGTTADAIIDFGREVYVPWQLAEGKILYRDIAYFNGPVSPWFNALLFKTLGTSILTLFIANACILAAMVTMMYVLLARRFSQTAATVACAVMIAVTGVAKVNYNYLTPYSHEMTHGAFLCLAILCLITRYDGRFQLARWGMAGLCYGLVFLGKPEIFVAATALIGCSFLLRGWMHVAGVRDLLLQAAMLAAGSLAPVAICFLVLEQQLGAQLAWPSLLGGWPHIVGSEVTKLLFYRRVSGLADPVWNLFRIFQACLAMGSLLLGLYLLEKNFGKYRWWNPWSMLLLLFSLHLGGYLVIALHAPAFSVIAGLLFVAMIYMACRRPGDFREYYLLSCWSAFGLFLMAKIVLRPSFGFYGFVLAMPALVLAVAVAIDWLPKTLFPQTSGLRFRAALIVLLVTQTIVSLAGTANTAWQKRLAIGMGADRIRCLEQQGDFLRQATDVLRRDMRPGQTLLVLPEGVSLNYLLRRDNPTPHINFMQPEIVMYGEANVLGRLAENPSDYILLLSRKLPDYGLECFGQPGYGDQIMRWVQENYLLEQQFGEAPTADGEFGVQILKLQQKAGKAGLVSKN